MATFNYDPNIPVYAAPKTSFSTVGSVANAPASQVVEKETGTVAGQMNGLLTAGSDYLKTAESKAMRLANGRGLLNSSIGAGEGTLAGINAALPIATSDANIYANLTSQNNQAANTASLNNQTAGLDYGKSCSSWLLMGSHHAQIRLGLLMKCYHLIRSRLHQICLLHRHHHQGRTPLHRYTHHRHHHQFQR